MLNCGKQLVLWITLKGPIEVIILNILIEVDEIQPFVWCKYIIFKGIPESLKENYYIITNTHDLRFIFQTQIFAE